MISPTEKEVLRDFVRVALEHDIPFVLVGASAKILVFDSRYDISPSHTTEDWDIAVQVDWQAFAKLKQALTSGEEPLFTGTNQNEQRVRHKQGIAIDIIPFGGVEDANGVIVWPQSELHLSVTGFQAVYKNAELLEIEEGLSVPVATPPGLALLKMFAYAERHKDNDLRDFYSILDNYDKAGNETRLFEELGEFLASGKLEYEDAKAFLLGLDVQRIISVPTRNKLLQIFDQLQLADPYALSLDHLIGLGGSEKAEERARLRISRLFQAFRDGLTQEA
ncbi:MAG: hypothetical protein C4567_05440 [Deltaproteobacteria bacterium]|nr:MAG: hypothetical protein C4567_05440 [Deltaproteobacteria bacterium]